MSLINLPFDKWMDNVALAALSSRETVRASYDIARLAIERGVPGDFVECGVFGGAQCAAMARAIMEGEPGVVRDLGGGASWAQAKSSHRQVHLFDSFTGIPAPGPNDGEWPHPPGTSACGLEDCKAHMREWGIPDELLVWHPGLFHEALPRAIVGLVSSRIAVLRLDGDLYESTSSCMRLLYPLLVPGGWLIIDDYALPGCRKAVDEYLGAFGPIYHQKGKV